MALCAKDSLGGWASFVLSVVPAPVVVVAATATRCGWFVECAGRCIGLVCVDCRPSKRETPVCSQKVASLLGECE
jgi:hypothetical protein